MLNNWLGKYNLYLAQEYFIYLLLLIPIYLFFYQKYFKKKNDSWKYSAPVIHSTVLLKENKWLQKSRKLLNSIRLVSIVFIIIVLSRPQITNTQVVKTQEGIDIVISLDVSGSMFAEDFTPNRLEAAKIISEEFIQNRYGDRIGLVIFSGESFTQCPVTLDHRVLVELLKRANGQFLESGTNIGNGIASAINNLKNSNGTSKIIILMTDGYEEVNTKMHISPDLAVQMANEFGVKVYTIGVGTKGQALVPVRSINGQLIKEMRDVHIDEETLTMIADKTGGKYYRATDNTSLQNIYKEINQLEKSTAEFQAFTEYKDILHVFLLLAFLLIIVEIGLKYSVFKSITE